MVMIDTSSLFVKLKFSEEQLDAIRSLYYKYFEPKMPAPNEFRGTSNIAMWREGMSHSNGLVTSDGIVRCDFFGINGFDVHECNDDPLWDAFASIMPYMGKSAVITKMPSRTKVVPHIDRMWRPIPIYFPIAMCNSNVVSTFYEKSEEGPAVLKPIANFSIDDNAYLMNATVTHGVKNNQRGCRIAFGWNFKTEKLSFEDCKDILSKAGLL